MKINYQARERIRSGILRSLHLTILSDISSRLAAQPGLDPYVVGESIFEWVESEIEVMKSEVLGECAALEDEPEITVADLEREINRVKALDKHAILL
jgi:hypothetical protein